MPQQIYPMTDEWQAMGAVFREDFTSPDTCSKNGTILVGSPAVNRGISLNGTTQYATNPKRLSLNGQGFIVVRFTPSFNYDENVNRYLLSCGGHWALANNLTILKYDVGSGSLSMTVSIGTTTIVCSAATYGPRWLVGQENVLVVSLSGVTSKVWLNGYDVGGASAAMTLNNMSAVAVGAKYDGNFKFAGSIQSLIIGNRSLTQGCEERLITDEPLSRIRTENSLVTIPGVQAYNRASDGMRVTPLLGKIATQHGLTEAIVGDGLTATTFPTLITPRGFSFDGGDYLNLGDHDAFSFTNGVNDLPFSLAVQCRLSSLATNRSLISKYFTALNGEWEIYVQTAGYLIFILIDTAVPIYAQIYSAAGFIKPGVDYTIVGTYTGSGGANGMKLYVNGSRVTVTTDPQNYIRMRNTAHPVHVGRDVGGGFVAGNEVLPEIYDVDLSECEVRALTARMQRQARSR